jgi:sporulation protein YlmC with PRC-barrel domain
MQFREENVPQRVLTIALATLLAAAPIVLYPPLSATSEAQAESSRATTGGGVEPSQIRASQLLRSAVYNARDIRIGEVKDLILDKDGRVAAVIIDVAFVGFGDKYIAVGLSDIGAGSAHLMLDRTSDQLQQMTSYKLEDGTRDPSSNPAARSIILLPR